MDNMANSLGENGACQFSDAEISASLTLFNIGVRGMNINRMKLAVARLMSMGEWGQLECALCIMQLRDIRKGKGERDASIKMLFEFSRYAENKAITLISLFPHYGCWRDLLLISDEENRNRPTENNDGPLTQHVVQIFAYQLQSDAAMSDNNISLAAKWAPRIGHKWGGLGKKIAKCLFPKSNRAYAYYRKLISGLTRAIDCPEQKMCAKQFSEINFNKVPSIAMMKYGRAFLNESLNPLTDDVHINTGDRYPLDQDRIMCRQKILNIIESGELNCLKGAVVDPSLLVRKTIDRNLSELETIIVDKQWSSMISDIEKNLCDDTWEEIPPAPHTGIGLNIVSLKDGCKWGAVVGEENDRWVLENGISIDKVSENKAWKFSSPVQNSLDLRKMVALVDVSGSMSGRPMEAAIALGLIIQEIANPVFKRGIITFESEPQWIEIPERTDQNRITDCIRKVQNAPWGGSTNIEAALDLILAKCVRANEPVHEIPTLIVLSDMQFDKANNAKERWSKIHVRILKKFKETGIVHTGKPWSPPDIVYWNLRGDTNGNAVSDHTPGVCMLSGYSPKMLEQFIQKCTNTGSSKNTEISPWMVLRSYLDAERYDIVRHEIAKIG